MAASARKLDGLEALRGIAALVVLLHHAFGSISLPQNFDTRLLWGVFEEGRLGVNVFFVLSGFVITWSNPNDGRSPTEGLIYFLRRTTRIYPMYWVACLTMLPIYWVFAPSAIGAVTPERVAHDALLLPYSSTPMLRIAWTLIYEMLFYTLFLPMLFSRRAGLTMWALIAAAIVALAALGVQFRNPWLATITSTYVLEFLTGMAVCLMIRKRPLAPVTARILVWTGVILMLGFVAAECRAEGRWSRFSLHYAFCAGLLVAGLVSLPSPPGGHGRLFRIMQLLGLYSFSIYLFHVPIQQIMVKVALKLTGADPGLPIVIAVLLATIAGSLAIGILAGRFIEIPMLEWCKRQIARLKPREPRPVAGAQA